jgi:hypothetical protein
MVTDTDTRNMEKIFLYGMFGFFLFLIINWLLNEEKTDMRRLLLKSSIIEGAENPAPAVKCPESCTMVKELQKKLSDSVKKAESLEQTIVQNTLTSQAHAKSIADLNEALNEMQKNQKDE